MEWRAAMRAELAGVEPGRDRWRFVAGCLRVVATQERMPSPGYAVLVVGVLVTAVELTAATGFGCGVVAAGAWLALVFAYPPVPASIGPAVLLIGAAMGAAAWANRGRSAGLAALCAGTVAVPPIVLMVAGLSRYGPASLIPNVVPEALTPADRLANSRIEIEDPYVGLLFLGAVTGAALAVVARRRYSPR